MKRKKFSLYKEIRAGLNLWAINLKFPQILDNYITYNLWKFWIDSINIEAWSTHEKVEFLLNKEIRAGLNFIGINLKFSQIVDNNVTYNLWHFRIDSIKIETSTDFFIQQKFYLLMGRPGLNVNAINPKFLQFIGNIVVYNLWKFQIDSENFFRYMGRLGLSFNAINPKFVQIIGDTVVYNMWQFQIDSSQIEITMNILFTQTVKRNYAE